MSNFAWLGVKGSNLEPSGSEPDTLPIELTPNKNLKVETLISIKLFRN